jgi:hypothetical protein
MNVQSACALNTRYYCIKLSNAEANDTAPTLLTRAQNNVGANGRMGLTRSTLFAKTFAEIHAVRNTYLKFHLGITK